MKRTPRPHSLTSTSTVAAAVITVLLSACGSPFDDLPADNLPLDAAGRSEEDGALAPVGWKQVRIRSHYTDITIDASGHYGIERNNCWVGGAGALELKPWNRMVKILNRWVKRGDTRTRSCTKVGTDIRSFDGWLEVAQDPQPAPSPGASDESGAGTSNGFGGMRLASLERNESPVVNPPGTTAPNPAPPTTQPRPPGTPNNPPGLPPVTTVPTPPRLFPPIATPALPTAQPFPSPSPSPMIVWTKVLDSDYGGDACTTWGNAQESAELIAVLDEIIPVIFAEDCTMPPS